MDAMRLLALAVILGCGQAESPSAPQEAQAPPKPAASPSNQETAARTRASVEKTRSQKSYSVSFKAVIQAPDSDRVTIQGESVWVAPGVLFTQYTGAGGDEVRLVRAGDKVWLWHILVEEWFTAEESGKAGAGRGVQNPDEVLLAIIQVADQSTAGGKEAAGDVLEMKLDGAALQKVLKQQAADAKLDLVNSSGRLRLITNAKDGLMYGMNVSADVASTEPHLKGKKITYSADISLKAYNKDFGLEFTKTDPATKKSVTIPWLKDFIDEAGKLNGIPDELKAELQKRRPK